MQTMNLILNTYILFSFIGYAKPLPVNDSTTLHEVEIVEKKSNNFFDKILLPDTLFMLHYSLSERLRNETELHLKSNNDGGLQTISFRGSTSSQSKIYWNEIPVSIGMNGIFSLSNVQSNNHTAITIHAIGNQNLVNYSGGGSLEINGIIPKKQSFEIGLSKGSYGYNNINANAVLIQKKIRQHFNVNAIWNKANYPYRLYKEMKQRAHNDYSLFNANYDWYYIQKNKVIRIQNIYSNNNKHLPENIYTIADAKSYQIDNNFISKISLSAENPIVNYDIFAAYQWQRIIFIHPFLKVRSISNSHIFHQQFNGSKSLQIQNTKLEISHKSAFRQFYINTNEYYNNVNVQQYNSIFSLDVSRKKWSLQPSLHHILQNKKWHYNAIIQGNVNVFKQKNHALYVGINTSRAINLPNFNDMYWPISGNKNLLPEKCQSAALKAMYAFKNNSFEQNFSVEYFAKQIENQIVWQPNAALGAGIWSPYNIKSTQANGFSTQLELNYLWRKFVFSSTLNYQYCKSVNTTETNGIQAFKNYQLVYVPKHKSSFSLSAQYKNFALKYNMIYLSERFISSDNNYFLPYYFKHDVLLSKSWKIQKTHCNTSISCTNIFQAEIEEISGFPLPLRQFNFSLNIKI